MIKLIPPTPSKPISSLTSEQGADSTSLLHANHSRDHENRNMESPSISSLRYAFRGHPSEEKFFQILHAELQKSSMFYDKALVQFRIREERVCQGAAIVGSMGNIRSSDRWIIFARGAYHLYKDLMLLESYAILTYCAFSKILEKYDKWTGNNARQHFMTCLVQASSFADTTELQGMIRRCENMYNEASKNLVADARNSLHEDERLFLGMVAKISSEVMVSTLKSENMGYAPCNSPQINANACDTSRFRSMSDRHCEEYLSSVLRKPKGHLQASE